MLIHVWGFGGQTFIFNLLNLSQPITLTKEFVCQSLNLFISLVYFKQRLSGSRLPGLWLLRTPESKQKLGRSGSHAISAIFHIFHRNKIWLHSSIYHAELSKYGKIHKNPLQTQENWNLKLANCLQRNVCQGAGIALRYMIYLEPRSPGNGLLLRLFLFEWKNRKNLRSSKRSFSYNSKGTYCLKYFLCASLITWS